MNVAPTITGINAPTNSNTVSTIGYYLTDPCADKANIKVEVWTTTAVAYTIAQGAAGAPYGTAAAPTASTYTGKALSFSRDNSAAVQVVQDTNVYIRMTPNTRNTHGATQYYGPFTVDNRMTYSVATGRASGATLTAALLRNVDHDGYLNGPPGASAGAGTVGTVSVAINNATGSHTTPLGSFHPGFPANADNRYATDYSGAFF